MTDVILENARARALEETEAAIIDAEDHSELHLLMTLQTRRRAILHPGWRPPRPPRRLPELWAIVSYWAERDTFGDIKEVPHCFGCDKIVTGISSGPDLRSGGTLPAACLSGRTLLPGARTALTGLRTWSHSAPCATR